MVPPFVDDQRKSYHFGAQRDGDFAAECANGFGIREI